MIIHKDINRIIIGLVIITLLFTGCLYYIKGTESVSASSSGKTMPYETSVFNKMEVMEVEISTEEGEWEELLENALAEEYIPCDITINGAVYKNVGIRCKGNTSLTQVASSDSDRYSFKVKFDEYQTGLTCDGLDKLALNNIFCDATYMKEYLSYDMLSAMGVVTPLYSYAHLTVNGEEWGLYLAVECIEESFAQRNYGSDYGALYKVESTNSGGGGEDAVQEERGDFSGDQQEDRKLGERPQLPENQDGEAAMQKPSSDAIEEQFPEAGETVVRPEEAEDREQMEKPEEAEGVEEPEKPEEAEGTEDGEQPQKPGNMDGGFDFAGGGRGMGKGGFGGGGTDLVYTDDEESSYSGILENAAYDVTDAQKKSLIAAIKGLNSGENLEEYVNVDQNLRYFAVNTFLVNDDSYISNLQHNFYLYEKDGQISPIPWDYNLAFGGFQSGNASSAVNDPIDSPTTSDVSLEERPFIGVFLTQEAYLEDYHEKMQELLDIYMNNGTFETTISYLEQLIAPYVKEDATAFYTYEEFTEAVENLKTFGTLRTLSVQGQLDGTIPSTQEGQQEDSSSLIDASNVNLSAMGTQGGDMGNKATVHS